MWGAIKSDLLSFVTTIQEDTTKTLSRVLGDEEPEVGLVQYELFELESLHTNMF